MIGWYAFQSRLTATHSTAKVNNLIAALWRYQKLQGILGAPNKRFSLASIMSSARNMSEYYSRFAVLNMSPRLFSEFLIVTGVVTSIWISDNLQLPKEQTLSSLSVIGFAALRMIPLINSINLGINQLRSGGRTLENIEQLLNSGGGLTLGEETES